MDSCHMRGNIPEAEQYGVQLKTNCTFLSADGHITGVFRKDSISFVII
jgi:hypothetical protein